MSRSVLLVLCLGVGHVAGDRSSPASLVQLKSQFAHVLSRAGDGQVHSSQKEEYVAQHEALLGFQKYVTGLVERVIDSPDTHNTNLTAEEETAIDTIIGYIDSLYSHLVQKHNTDLEYIIENCEDKFDCCTAELAMGNVYSHFDSADAGLHIHHGCRTAELTLYHDMSTSCGEYCDKKRSDEFPACVGEGDMGDPYLGAEEGTAELATFEACLVLVKQWYETILPLSKSCQADREEWESKHGECNLDQKANERGWCSFADDRDGVCTLYQSCWDDAWANCESVCPGIQDNVLGRKVCNRTGEEIKCLLNVLLDENPDKKNALNDCIALDKSYNPEWNITCPQEGYEVQPPLPLLPNDEDESLEEEHLNCSSPMYRPREESWQCYVYGYYGQSAHNPDACTDDQGQDFDNWETVYKFTHSSDVEGFEPCDEE